MHSFFVASLCLLEPQSSCWDVQLRYFSSFTYGIIKSTQAQEFYKQAKVNSNLLVQETYSFQIIVIEEYYHKMIINSNDAISLNTIQHVSLYLQNKVIQEHSLEALLVSHDIWHNFPNALRN